MTRPSRLRASLFSIAVLAAIAWAAVPLAGMAECRADRPLAPTACVPATIAPPAMPVLSDFDDALPVGQKWIIVVSLAGAALACVSRACRKDAHLRRWLRSIMPDLPPPWPQSVFSQIPSLSAAHGF